MNRRCRAIELHMTALADGELSRFRRWRVTRHLSGCPKCRRLADSFSISVAAQSRSLARAIAVETSDPDGLRRRVRIQIAALPGESSVARVSASRSLRPLWAVATATVLLVLSGVAAWQSEEVVAMLASLGLVDPPAAVAHETELFHDYSIIRNLDALENYDDVKSLPLDEPDQTSQLGMRCRG